jgi:hypothetical protein
MSTETNEPATGAEDQPATGQTNNEPDTGKDYAAEVEKWRSAARKHEERAKANANAAKELERVRRESMNEQERAIAEAVEQARTAALAESRERYASRMVVSELRAAAAGRLDAAALDTLTARLDLAGFLTEDGDVDANAVERFVDSLAPPPEAKGFPSLGQGARGPTPHSLNGDPLLRDVKAKLGIR